MATERSADYKKRAKASGTNFYYSFLFLPKQRREAIYPFYTFCRLIDDIVDTPRPRPEAIAQLNFWRQELERCRNGCAQHPIGQQVQGIMQRFPIPVEYFYELLNGVEMDLERKRYENFDGLYQYCYRVASVVGLICIEIFGYQYPQVKDYAVHQGIAFQLTNILRDLKADANQDRIYLPQDELRRFNYSEEALRAGLVNQAFLELMAFQCQRARHYYDLARGELPPQDRRSLCAAEIMRVIYLRLLQQIEKAPGRVLAGEITLSRPHKLGLATWVWLRTKLSA